MIYPYLMSLAALANGIVYHHATITKVRSSTLFIPQSGFKVMAAQ